MTVDFSRLWGNETTKTALGEKLSGGNLSHAYLIAGPAGSGKKTLAFLLAAAIACEDPMRTPCCSCPSCRKILSGQSPDLQTLGLESLPLIPQDIAARDAEIAPPQPTEVPRSIGVDAVRRMQRDVYVMPTDLDRKLYIIGHADRMTVQAQNALLKILEEPPAGVVFILLCENRAALLPTVRSRVQTLQTEVFDDDALWDCLTSADQSGLISDPTMTETCRAARTLAARDPDRLRLYIRLSGGCVGGVKRYLGATMASLSQDAAYDAHETALACLSVVFAQTNADTPPVLGGEGVTARKTALYDLLSLRAATRETLQPLLDALSTAMRDLLYCCYVTEEEHPRPLFFADAAQPLSLAAGISPADVMAVSDALASLCASLEFNPNVAAVGIGIADALFHLRFK